MLLSLKSTFHLFKSIIVNKFVQYFKLNKITMLATALDSCSIVFFTFKMYFYD